ncbi:amidohydrolase family protein [Epilithonimonas sp.]|uniref:amidohydrolase family protein n=1 Tax=Epilithonimonas sp. TaxID=2894511 RepID=UPI0035B27CAB
MRTKTLPKMRGLYTIICLVFLIAGFAKSQTRKIIDVHFHTRSAGDYGTTPPPNPASGRLPHASSNEEIYSSNLVLLKKYNIVKAICSGTIARNTDFITNDPVRFLSSLEFPDHQNNPLPDTLTFKKMAIEKKFIAFGELGLQYEGKTLADPEYAPYLAICEQLGIPVLLHTGEAAPNTPYMPCCPRFRINSGRPLHIEPVLIKYPKLKVMLMHMGFPFLEETKAVLNVYPQVSVDISVIDWAVPTQEFYDYLKALIVAGFEKRIMYGSDQMIWEDAIELSVKKVEKAPFLSKKQKDDIFYNNAAKFFGIK